MKKSIGAKTLVYPTPVFVVGTYDKDGKPNAMVVAWGGICCSSPPCLAISVREATYTYGNLMENKAFTVCVPSESYLKEADFLGIASGRDMDKFARAGLTPVRSDLVNAPYVAEFPLAIECEVLHHFKIGLHTQFIGEIVDVKADKQMVENQSLPLIEKVRPLLWAPDSQGYYGIGGLLGKAFSVGTELL